MKPAGPGIIVDVDSTLWDFMAVCYPLIKREYPGLPLLSEFRWDSHKAIMPHERFLEHVAEIHGMMDRCEPYTDAAKFLAELAGMGYSPITVVSHHQARPSNLRKALEAWGLSGYVDGVHSVPTSDKTAFFAGHCAIVDDNPSTLMKAREHGLLAVGLRFPWNTDLDGIEGVVLTDSLIELLPVCKSWLGKADSPRPGRGR